jgi:hypothetical protein
MLSAFKCTVCSNHVEPVHQYQQQASLRSSHLLAVMLTLQIMYAFCVCILGLIMWELSCIITHLLLLLLLLQIFSHCCSFGIMMWTLFTNQVSAKQTHRQPLSPHFFTTAWHLLAGLLLTLSQCLHSCDGAQVGRSNVPVCTAITFSLQCLALIFL